MRSLRDYREGMTLQISRIDPFNTAAVDAWWDAYAAAQREDRGPMATVWSREEIRHQFQQESRTTERRAYLLLDDDAVVGAAGLALPLKDNTHVANISIEVPPAERRRGVGSTALTFLEGEAVTAGRTTVRSDASWPYELGADGTGSPGREFARRHGYALALRDVQSRLALPVDLALLDSIGEDIAPAVEGYTLRSWVGPVPEDVIEDWAVLDASIDTEAPSGDLDNEQATPDVDGVRETESLLAQQRRISLGAVALTANGEVAAYSQLVISRDDGNAYQWGTLVRGSDRGHRLGTAVKIANLRLLHSTAAHTRAVYTYNAESNVHMRAVNTRLGFIPSERMAELQKRLS